MPYNPDDIEQWDIDQDWDIQARRIERALDARPLVVRWQDYASHALNAVLALRAGTIAATAMEHQYPHVAASVQRIDASGIFTEGNKKVTRLYGNILAQTERNERESQEREMAQRLRMGIQTAQQAIHNTLTYRTTTRQLKEAA